MTDTRSLTRGRRPLAVALVLLVVGAGCVPARNLRKNERVNASSDEAYVVLAVNVPEPVTLSINLCKDGNVQACFPVQSMASAEGIRIYAVPAARYCLQQILLEDGASSLDMMLGHDSMQCFVVEPGALNYPGHLEVDLTPTQFSTTRVQHRFIHVRGVDRQLQRDFPHVADLPFLEPVLTPMTSRAPPWSLPSPSPSR